MNTTEILKVAVAILGSLGGGALIIGAFVHWLGGVWASRLIQREKRILDAELESHKVRLKKSEFIFQKEYEAASIFIAYSRNLLPTYRHPLMDWNDACDEMAMKLGDIEKWIQNYIALHGAILSEEAVTKLSDCKGLAGVNKFDSGGFDEPVSAEANEAAESIHRKFEEIEKILIKAVKEQATT